MDDRPDVHQPFYALLGMKPAAKNDIMRFRHIALWNLLDVHASIERKDTALEIFGKMPAIGIVRDDEGIGPAARQTKKQL